MNESHIVRSMLRNDLLKREFYIRSKVTASRLSLEAAFGV